MIDDVMVRKEQMFKQCCFFAVAVVKRYHFIEELGVATFTNVITYTKNQPQRVIIEIRTNVCITALCKRLELMVSTSILKLCCSNIEQAFP